MAIDWSWGQACKTQSFGSPYGAPPTPPDDSLPQDARLKDAVQFALAAPAPDIFASGFTINEFRTAVPSPATCAQMADLSREQANVPRPPFHHQSKPAFAGRKRSCAEMSSEDDDSSAPHTTSSLSDPASASPTKAMRLDDDGNAMDATGVSAEELAERLRSSSFPDGSLRPRLPESRKSMRLEPQTSVEELAQVEDANTMAIDDGHALSRVRTRTLSDHDEARFALGVGWASVPATPVMLAAARGWSRFIETSFPLRNVRIVWRNESQKIILISAVTTEFAANGRELPGSPGYYLLDESFTQGCLVAKSWERCLDCLRAKPIRFEGDPIVPLNGVNNGEDNLKIFPDASAQHVLVDRPMGMEID